MLKKLIIVTAFLFPAFVQAQSVMPETLLIDVPTASVLDKYQASMMTRTYANGSVMESLDFGVWPQLNIGLSLAVYELIGNSEDIKILAPDFQVKWKLRSDSPV